MTVLRHLSFSAVALVVALAFSAPAMAQSLPSWAAPGNDSSFDQSFDERSLECASADCDDTPPGNPGTPAVPVDGGLGLLALAGAGYAVRKLRQKPEA